MAVIVDRFDEGVDLVINLLSNRRGFDDWWENIDYQIQEEIKEALIDGLESFYS